MSNRKKIYTHRYWRNVDINFSSENFKNFHFSDVSKIKNVDKLLWYQWFENLYNKLEYLQLKH